MQLQSDSFIRIDKRILYLALAVLLAVTAVALAREGFAGMKTPFSASFWTWQYFIDLVIALGIFMIWMWRDCRRRGKSPLPWIIATCLLGSITALIYLIVRQAPSQMADIAN